MLQFLGLGVDVELFARKRFEVEVEEKSWKGYDDWSGVDERRVDQTKWTLW